MREETTVDRSFPARLPRLIALGTALVLAAGAAACVAWWRSGDPAWMLAFFSGPGAVFFLGCGLLETWLSFQCWRRFSPGDLLRPAWLLIFATAVVQVAGAIVNQLLGAQEIGQLFGPIQMILLACALWFVLKACRRNGILGRLRTVDFALLTLVVAYTAWFFVTIVFRPPHGGRPLSAPTFISWSSDPLLCVLLFQAILIRRSTANMGFGLISRCWLSFTAAIFLTSVGDISLWAWAEGYLPYALVVASWFVWFLPSAAYALGPAYQLIAMLRATSGDIEPARPEPVVQ